MNKIIYTITVLAVLAIAAQSAFGAVILSTGFEEPTFEQNETLPGSAINGVDGSATGEGVWWATNDSILSDGAPFAVTADGYGATAGASDGGLYL